MLPSSLCFHPFQHIPLFVIIWRIKSRLSNALHFISALFSVSFPTVSYFYHTKITCFQTCHVFSHIKIIIIIIVLLFLKLFPLPPFPSLLFSKSYCLYIFAFGLPLAWNNISLVLSMSSSFLWFRSQMKCHLIVGHPRPSTPKDTLTQQFSHNPASGFYTSDCS